MQNINTALSQGDCDRAQRNYNAWKIFAKSADAAIESKIAACKSEKSDTLTVQPTTEEMLQVETQLEISTSKLSFNGNGDDKRLVFVTSNVPWLLSY